MKKEADTAKRQLDGLLAGIGDFKASIASLQKTMSDEIERVVTKHKPTIQRQEEELKLLEEELYGLAKFNKADLFADTDRLDLTHGAVLRQVQRKVKRIKGMLERLKTMGRVEAVKVVESVDWDQVEKYPDTLLEALGTKRVPKEVYSYETKTVGG
jgi:phage host-nuclease inhibitor protein Gam